MDRRAQLADMKRRHADQLAYGSKGTHLGNRIAELEDELRPAWLRLARRIGFWALAGVCLLTFWLPILAGIWQHLYPLIRAMMGQG